MCRKFLWADAEFQNSKYDAVVARYRNIPEELRNELDRLVVAEYSDKLFIPELFKASAYLTFSPILTQWKKISQKEVDNLKHYYGNALLCGLLPLLDAGCDFEEITDQLILTEWARGVEFACRRKPDERIVMVMYHDELLATMTIFPFEKKADIPSGFYLEIDDCISALPPNARSVEIGRLVKKPKNRIEHQEIAGDGIIAIIMAYVMANKYCREYKLFAEEGSYVCGDTHGILLEQLEAAFPKLVKFRPAVNSTLALPKSKGRGLLIYFWQRYLLGEALGDKEDFVSAINNLKFYDQKNAIKIEELLAKGFRRLGINRIEDFDPKHFRIYFFFFSYPDRTTQESFAFMEALVKI